MLRPRIIKAHRVKLLLVRQRCGCRRPGAICCIAAATAAACGRGSITSRWCYDVWLWMPAELGWMMLQRLASIRLMRFVHVFCWRCRGHSSRRRASIYVSRRVSSGRWMIRWTLRRRNDSWRSDDAFIYRAHKCSCQCGYREKTHKINRTSLKSVKVQLVHCNPAWLEERSVKINEQSKNRRLYKWLD